MMKRKGSVLLMSSVILQGCSAIASLIPTILSVLGNSNIMGAISGALGSAGKIAGAFGKDDVAKTLGTASEVTQAIPGAVNEATQTVQRTRTVFAGEGETTQGEMNDKGGFFDTAQRTARTVSSAADKVARTTGDYANTANMRAIQRNLNKVKDTADDVNKGIDKAKDGIDKAKDGIDKGQTMWEKFKAWLKGGGDKEETPPVIMTAS